MADEKKDDNNVRGDGFDFNAMLQVLTPKNNPFNKIYWNHLFNIELLLEDHRDVLDQNTLKKIIGDKTFESSLFTNSEEMIKVIRDIERIDSLIKKYLKQEGLLPKEEKTRTSLKETFLSGKEIEK